MLALIMLVIVFVITMMNKEWSESGQEAEDVVVMTKWKALLPFL
ncbi:hypothetical protein ACLMAB_07260 [Brevibacillus laterosporus]